MYDAMGKNPETTGTNQLLSNTQQLQHFTAQQLLNIQDQNQEIKTAQKDYFIYQKQKDVADQKVIQKKFRSAESRAWRTNKIYKDHY
jgi:ATP-dependent exoDNAse (exonuclease V) alpha subunit